MIRPAPSSIILGSGDLKQFEIRQKQYMQLKAERKSVEASGHNSTPAPLLYQTSIRTRSFSVRGVRGDEDSLSHGSTGSPPTIDSECPTPAGPTESEIRQISIGYHSSPENASIRALPPSPLKVDHEYAGLPESLVKQRGNDASQQSSPFSIRLSTLCTG